MLDTPEESHDTSQNRSSQNRSSQTDPQQPSSGGPVSPDDSPELLRWRADILLDEMMLGAVDIAAGRPESASSDGNNIPLSANTSTSHSPTNSTTDTGAFEGGPRMAADDAPSLNSMTSSSLGSARPAPAPYLSESRKPAESSSFERRIDASPDPDPWVSESSPTDWLGRSMPPSPAERVAHSQSPHPPFSQETPPGSASGGGDSMLRPPSASTALSDAQAGTTNSANVGASDAVAWSVGEAEQSSGKQNLRSNLLPRESQFDARGHFQEIDLLEAEVAATLPSEHEWSVRSRHLLAKATDILRNSPERSAEVDYYLQQVRSILERAQQTYRWSLIYTKRLKIYLGSWGLLSAIIIVGCLLYTQPLTAMISDWFPGLSSYWTQTLIALTVAICAGTLGASIGALRNMLLYRSAGRGFVDRKYSLRGLFLPLMAGLFGLLIYLLFGVIFYFAGIDPMQNLLVLGVPAMLAFAFGLAQESLYGTAG